MKKTLLGAMLLMTTLIADDISTYEYAKYQDVASVKAALSTNKFQVIGEYDAMNDSNYHVIAYTCPTLKKLSSKENREMAAVQKVLVNKKDKTLVLTNPEYFLSAFLQDDFDGDAAKKVNSKLQKLFGDFTGSEDKLEDDDISGYHFMMSMPYYEDMVELAEGKDLLAKLEKNAGKNVVFKLDINGATVVGIAMPTENGEATYVEAIKGQNNAAFLPYMVVIKGDSAKMMHPKYYLAISNPMLSMGDFMGISGTPDDIEEYMTSLFK